MSKPWPGRVCTYSRGVFVHTAGGVRLALHFLLGLLYMNYTLYSSQMSVVSVVCVVCVVSVVSVVCVANYTVNNFL